MPHTRKRHALAHLKKLADFWPVTGVIGPRQVGKSTLVRDQLGGLASSVTLDDDDMRDAAERSAKVFLAGLSEPALIDEIQKVPKVFDAIKSTVDKRRKPGRFFLTGSVDFSMRIGVRESLTGRIGLLSLLPMTVSECHSKPMEPARCSPFHGLAPRFGIEELTRSLSSGGMPVPAFIRDESQRELYFQSWIEAALLRDAARAYGRSYDFDFAYRVLADLARLHRDGELPSITRMKFPARKLARYLRAFQDIFLLQKVSCHEAGVGRDAYLFTDSGIASHLMKGGQEEGAVLSRVRIRILNEILALHRYQGRMFIPVYYKSQKADAIDWIWDGVPMQISVSSRTTGWSSRALEGAMRKLGSARGVLIAPVDRPVIEKKGISILPWSYWC